MLNKKYKIDIISDLHLDSWLNYMITDESKLFKIYSEFYNSLCKDLKSSNVDTIIIPGDIGHYNHQNISFLKFLKTKYKNVIVTHGNHDLYLISNNVKKRFVSSLNRLNNFIEECITNDIIYLDGDIIDLDGTKILGASSWYDGSYCKSLNSKFENNEEILKLWRDKLNDPVYISDNLIGSHDFFEYFNYQYNKLCKNIFDADIIFTHVCPVSKLIPNRYKLDPVSGFYCFDSSDIMNDHRFKDKIWIFGHFHDQIDYFDYETSNWFICNPLGNKNNEFNGIITIEN